MTTVTKSRSINRMILNSSWESSCSIIWNSQSSTPFYSKTHRVLIYILVGILLPFLVILISTLYRIPYVFKMDVSDPACSARWNTKETESLPCWSRFNADMPDPCAATRRNTGVEDLLCMEPPKFLKQYKNPCWIDNGTFRCLPYFYLFGNAKCGTTDFFRRINLHPDILPNKGIFQKETMFWSRWRLRPSNSSGNLLPSKTFRQFTDYFRGPEIKNSSTVNGYHYKITCLGDPMDLYDRFDEENLPQNTPGAEELLWTTPYVIRHIQPDVKLLLLLRDPIDRLYSHYFHGSFGTSSETFHNHTVQSIKVLKECFGLHSVRHCLYSKAISDQLKTPIYASFDVVHLKEWSKAFPLKQMMIFRNEDFSKDIRGTLIRVFEFVNISIPNEAVLRRMSSMPRYRETVGKKKAGPMLQETRVLLKTLFQPYVNELAKVLADDRFLFRDTNFS